MGEGEGGIYPLINFTIILLVYINMSTTDNIVSFPSKSTKQRDIYIYVCNCIDSPKNLTGRKDSLFYILEDGYECFDCGKIHTFEQVHGAIDG